MDSNSGKLCQARELDNIRWTDKITGNKDTTCDEKSVEENTQLQTSIHSKDSEKNTHYPDST